MTSEYGVDARLSRVEQRLASAEQRVSDIDTRVTAQMTVTEKVVTLVERVETIRRDLAGYSVQVAKLDQEIASREAISRQERRQARVAMWTLTVMILCALIGAAALILTSSGVQ